MTWDDQLWDQNVSSKNLKPIIVKVLTVTIEFLTILLKET